MKNLNADITYDKNGVIFLNIVTDWGKTLSMAISEVQRDLLLWHRYSRELVGYLSLFKLLKSLIC